MRRALLGIVLLCAIPLPAQRRTENVVLLVTDGLRWQEAFRAACGTCATGSVRWSPISMAWHAC